MKKIMIDMDDVIVSGGFLYLINEFLGTNYKEEDFTSYYMQDIIPDKKAFFEFFLTKNMYENSTLKDNAVEVIKELNEQYEIYIVTSYMFLEIPNKSGIVITHKYDYLVENLPFLNSYNFVFISDKSIIDCDIKIDDKIENLDGADMKILYTAYHNKNLTDKELLEKNVIRVNCWEDIRRILLKELSLDSSFSDIIDKDIYV